MAHITGNLKKEQLLEERYTEIDRENRILLKKMSDIMKQPAVGTMTPREARPVSLASGPTSLNRDARKKELVRITKENQLILKRIQQAQPVYNHVEWEGANRRNIQYVRNCAEHPLVLRSARGRPSEMVRLDDGPMSARSAPAQSSQQYDQVDSAKQVVFSENMTLIIISTTGGSRRGNFVVEMITDGRKLRISASDEDAGVSLEHLVSERSHRRLYRDCNGDYHHIAEKLQVVNGRLVLDEFAPPALPAPVAEEPKQAWQEDLEEEEEKEEEEEPKMIYQATFLDSSEKSAMQEDIGEQAESKEDVKLPAVASASPSARPRPPSGTSHITGHTEEDDELDAAGLVVPLTRGSVHAEVDIQWNPPDSAELADVQVRLRGLTPSPDNLSLASPMETQTSFGR
jgi:E3 ubiquitin-protein ligase TRIP12